MKNVLLLFVFIVFIFVFMPACTPRPAAMAAPPVRAQGSPRLANLLSAQGVEGYAYATAPRQFTFPEDHGSHTDFRNEWWYVTGNLDGEDHDRFGFELTLFRFSITPEAATDPSDWRSNQVYIGHFAVTDSTAGVFHVAERYSRGGAGLAGAQSDPLRVWIEDWALHDATGIASGDTPHGGQWHLQASDTDIAVDLMLTALKPPVLNGIGGLSQKSAVPGNATYYYSMPRMQTSGTLRAGTKTYRVNGLSWLDREWGSAGLSDEQQGWDWFALQLSDGSDLMFYELRRSDGARDSHSAGTYVAADGTSTPLSREDVVIDVLEYWDSPQGGRYPMAWRIGVASLGLHLRVTPIMTGQELATLVRYWEGAVDVEGYVDEGNRIGGRGYVELTGYADDRITRQGAID